MDLDQVLVALGASALVKYFVMYFMKDKKPQNLEYVGKISALKLFPVKSLGEIDIKRANCTKMGLEYEGFFDRRWLIVNSEMRMITLTMQPRFSKLKTKFLDDGIEIHVQSNPNIPTLTLTSDLSKFDKNDRVEIQLYGEKCTMYDCGSAAQEWLDKFFDLKGFKFLYFPPEVDNRSVSTYKPKYPWVSTAGDHTDLVGCANFAPYLLGSESSLKDLNERVEGNPLVMLNFRPNIIIEGAKPWDEDDWEYIFINNACFKRIKDCTRCPMTTIDLEKSKVREDGEPLKTLLKFRIKPELYGKKAMFGLNALIKRPGRITVGDEVYVIRTSEFEKGYY